MAIDFFADILFSQSFQINKIESPNWWSKIKYYKTQFVSYDQNLN